jgi:hypothetical protein
VQDSGSLQNRCRIHLVRRESFCIAPFPVQPVPATIDTWLKKALPTVGLRAPGIALPAKDFAFRKPIETARTIVRARSYGP